jgi:polysaccharide pyruvyl transferase WcaK-like protein
MRDLTVGLLWHTFGHPNRGIDALTRSNITILRRAAERAGVRAKFVLLGTVGPHAPDDADIIQGPPPRLKQLATGRSQLPAAIKACNVVFDISEGDSFADIYGLKRYLVQSWSKLLALRNGGVLVLSPQTIGPFDAAWARVGARHILRRSRLIFSRDGLSTQALADLGVSARSDEAIDVAFALPFERPSRNQDSTVKVGINVSGLMYLAAHRFQMSLDYPGFIREIISRFCAMPNVELWLTPHVLAEGQEDDDVIVSRQLQREYLTVKLAPTFVTASEAKSFISGLDFFTGARMHACIAAYSSGVPVVPIAYSRKFNGLFETLGYSHFIDGRRATPAAAVDQLMEEFGNRETLLASIKTGLKEADRRLSVYEDRVSQLFLALP